MRTDFAARLTALEQRAHGTNGAWLSVVYHEGARADLVAGMEADALAAHVAKYGAPLGKVSYIHRVMVARSREVLQ